MLLSRRLLKCIISNYKLLGVLALILGGLIFLSLVHDSQLTPDLGVINPLFYLAEFSLIGLIFLILTISYFWFVTIIKIKILTERNNYINSLFSTANQESNLNNAVFMFFLPLAILCYIPIVIFDYEYINYSFLFLFGMMFVASMVTLILRRFFLSGICEIKMIAEYFQVLKFHLLELGSLIIYLYFFGCLCIIEGSPLLKLVYVFAFWVLTSLCVVLWLVRLNDNFEKYKKIFVITVFIIISIGFLLQPTARLTAMYTHQSAPIATFNLKEEGCDLLKSKQIPVLMIDYPKKTCRVSLRLEMSVGESYSVAYPVSGIAINNFSLPKSMAYPPSVYAFSDAVKSDRNFIKEVLNKIVHASLFPDLVVGLKFGDDKNQIYQFSHQGYFRSMFDSDGKLFPLGNIGNAILLDYIKNLDNEGLFDFSKTFFELSKTNIHIRNFLKQYPALSLIRLDEFIPDSKKSSLRKRLFGNKKIEICANCGELTDISFSGDSVTDQLLILGSTMSELGFKFNEENISTNKIFDKIKFIDNCHSPKSSLIPASFMRVNNKFVLDKPLCDMMKSQKGSNILNSSFMTVGDLLDWTHDKWSLNDVVRQAYRLNHNSDTQFKRLSLGLGKQTVFYIENEGPFYYVLSAYFQPADISLVIATNKTVSNADKKALFNLLNESIVGV